MTRRTAAASGDDVVAGDPARPALGPQKGHEHAHGGGLARAVRPEEAEDLALGRRSGRCRRPRHVAEAADETLGLDRIAHERLDRRATPARACTACRCGGRRGGRRASTTAFCTAGVEPIVPDSPMPLAPSSLHGVGVSIGDALEARQLGGGDDRRSRRGST